MYARLKSTVLRPRFKAWWSRTSCRDAGREFHAAGPANEKHHSPVVRRSLRRLLEERSLEREAMPDVDRTRSCRYWGLRPILMRCIREHSLKITRCPIGSQCRSRNDSATWSRGPRARISRAAEFLTRCKGIMLDFGSPARRSWSNWVDCWQKPWPDWRSSSRRKRIGWFSGDQDENNNNCRNQSQRQFKISSKIEPIPPRRCTVNTASVVGSYNSGWYPSHFPFVHYKRLLRRLSNVVSSLSLKTTVTITSGN